LYIAKTKKTTRAFPPKGKKRATVVESSDSEKDNDSDFPDDETKPGNTPTHNSSSINSKLTLN